MNRRARCLGCFVLLVGVGLLHSQTQPASSPSQDSFQQGLLALQENRLEDALNAFTAAEQSQPNDARIHNFRGIVLMSMGKSEEAAAEYRHAIELDSNMEDGYRNLAFLEWTAHQPNSARAHLERALKLKPDDIFAHYYLARVEIEDGHYEKAVGLFKQLADDKGKSPAWVQFDLAMAHLQAGQYQQSADLAQELCQRAQSPPTECAPACTIFGVSSAKLGHREQAIAAFQTAAAAAPQQEAHWLNLTRELMDANQFAAAIQAVQEGLKSNPKSYALHLRLGAAYFSSGKYSDAEQSFRELVAAGDPLPLSYIGLAQVLLRTGRAPEAVTELAIAEQRIGPQFLIVYFRGLALNRAGSRTEALVAFKQAVQLNPNSAEAHLGVGKTSLLLGQTTEAEEELKTVLKLDPGNLQARRLLAQAYARLGDQANAAKYASAKVETETEPSTSLVGDFILPDWQQPAAY